MKSFLVVLNIIFFSHGDVIKFIDFKNIELNHKKIFSEDGANIAAVLSVPPQCKTCDVYENIWKNLADDAMPGVVYYKTEAASLPWVQNLLSPGIIIISNERKFLYQDELTSENVFHALRSSSNVYAFHLDDTSFEHDTQATTGSTTGDWLVIFDEKYDTYMPVYEGLALRLRMNHCNLALVRPSAAPRTVKRFDIGKNPPVIMIKKGNAYFHEFDAKDHEQLYKFASGWYKNARKMKVPMEITQFDELTEKIVQEIKKIESQFGAYTVRASCIGLFCFILVLIVVVNKTCSPSSSKKSKLEQRKKKE